MNVQTIEDMLGQVFRNQERLTRRELQQRIAQLHPSPRIENLAQALPDGAYDRYQAGAVLTQIQEEEGLWRDTVSREELDRAVARSGGTGQFDDQSGHEARTTPPAAPPEPAAQEPDEAEEPPEDDEQPGPGPEGRIGPH